MWKKLQPFIVKIEVLEIWGRSRGKCPALDPRRSRPSSQCLHRAVVQFVISWWYFVAANDVGVEASFRIWT